MKNINRTSISTVIKGTSTVIIQIPLAYFGTPPEESRRDAGVSPPVVTIQSTPPHSSSLAKNTSDYPRHSSHTGTSRSHPLVELTQHERSRTSNRHPPAPATSLRRRSATPRGRATAQTSRRHSVTPRGRATSRRRPDRTTRSPRSRRSQTRSPERRSSRHDRDKTPRSRDDRNPSRGRDSHDSDSRQARWANLEVFKFYSSM
jgi:hypothetical protein